MSRPQSNENPIYKRGERYDFTQLTNDQKDQVLKLAADFLTELDINAFTDLIIQYSWKMTECQELPDTYAFAIRQNLFYFQKQIHQL